MQEIEKNPTNKLRTRTHFQHFLNKALHSSFKKFITSTPLLLLGLQRMSLAKSVPNWLKPQECNCTKLPEPPPVPYIPEKDEVQEEVARLRNLQIKTLLEKDTTLNFPVWHKNGTREAFLMHVTVVLTPSRSVVTSRTTRRPKRLMWKPRKGLSRQRLG